MTEALLATAPAALPLTVSGHTFRMIPVRGGAFDMGDEAGDLWDACRPVHSVRLGDFCIGQFPVTQALWRAVAAGQPGPAPRGRADQF
ncbi:MAG: SUMF1/EgtB/PvdO family nonheme iron enzyme [Saprospirales bacterium]|nr:SUMF1/EgtB/PvdO family nonheme iron enzyme [Saprospirales bacterium]